MQEKDVLIEKLQLANTTMGNRVIKMKERLTKLLGEEEENKDK